MGTGGDSLFRRGCRDGVDLGVLTAPVGIRFEHAVDPGATRRAAAGATDGAPGAAGPLVGKPSCPQKNGVNRQKGITFTDKNIREDRTAMEELLKMGYRATPVTLIDGEAVVGFDRGKIERLLALA